MMNDMNSVFNDCWNNFEKSSRFSCFSKEELTNINELNQAVFSCVQKRLASCIKIRSVSSPAFMYYTELPEGYGVNCHAAYVSTYMLPYRNDTFEFEDNVELAVNQILHLVDIHEVKIGTIFFYMPYVPSTPTYDISTVKLRIVKEETVDV